MRFAGRYHQKNAIGAPAFFTGFNCTLYGFFANGYSGEAYIVHQMRNGFTFADLFHYFIGVFKLRHSGGITEVGDFNVLES